MILVLLLPAVTAWNRDLRPTPLRLETPMVVGYALVLVMGAGNYLGTRFAIAALFAAGASFTIVWPLSELGERYPTANSTLHAAATIAVSIATWLGARQAAKIRSVSPNPLSTVWNDFRDFFGIVWGRRVMDRVNHTAQQESWPVRLQFDGFVPIDAAKPGDLSLDQKVRVEQVLRWLLRRFVDPEWIDERIAA